MKIVYAIQEDGSHIHYRQGTALVCRINHKKVDIKGMLAWAFATGMLTLIVHIILKANNL